MLPLIIGHVFEQTHFKTVIFTINMRINHHDITNSLIDICIKSLGDVTVPIEVIEVHNFKNDLLFTLHETHACYQANIDMTLHCYVKGWFW